MSVPSLAVFMRHGESLVNLLRGSDIYSPPELLPMLKGGGDLDVPLTPAGRKEANRAGIALHERFGTFDVIYHSAAVRSRDSAVEAARTFQRCPPFREDWRINERDSGAVFGMTPEQVKSMFPWLDEYWNRAGWFYARPPCGESIADVALVRVPAFLRSLSKEHANQRVLVVTHGRFMQAVRVVLERLSTRDPLPNPSNCGWVAYSRTAHSRLELTDSTSYRNAPD